MSIDTSVVRLDFEVKSGRNCKNLQVLDLSNWGIAADNAAYLSILTPGMTVPVEHILTKNTINIFNISNLGISDVTDYSTLGPLPDGVYTITLLQCKEDPLAVTKYYLQDCLLRCQLARKVLSIDLSCNSCKEKLLAELQEIQLYLDAAQANAELCMPLKAMELYQKANTLLTRMTDEESSTCYGCS